MLKEDPRYDYTEEAAPVTRAAWNTLKARRAKPKGLVLPVGLRIMQTVACFPLQQYLRERFSHIGGLDQTARLLRAENQRRHDIAASLGHWPMSRTA